MSELHDLSALEQAAAVRRRDVSPVELVRHYLARIERLDPVVGAFITVTAGAALEQARAAEAAVGGASRGQGLAPLHGVPTAIKDLNLVAGQPLTLGSKAFDGTVARLDDFVVTLLRQAGTISLGKTNTSEFGLAGYTEPDVAAPARTPWDTARGAGGSSGGAAAAVAAGLVPFAQASDGGGSVRIPASVCGLFGIKVSRGRVSNGPLMGDLTGLAWNGPLARSVADAAAMLDAMAVVPMPGDPHWAPPLPPGETFLAHASREPGRLRIGRHITNALDVPIHADVIAAYEATSALLADLGHEVVDIEPTASGELEEDFRVLWSVAACSVPCDPSREHLLRPLTRWLRELGRSHAAARYLGALANVQLAARAAVGQMLAYDAVLTPTLAQPPAPVGSLRNDDDPEADFRAQAAFAPYPAVANLLGIPAVNVPIHWTHGGLPIGSQLLGRPGDEAGLIRLSAQLEEASGWTRRRPPLW